MDIENFRRNAHGLVDWMADYLNNIEAYPVRSQVGFNEISERLPLEAPIEGEEFQQIFDDFKEIILPGMSHWQHPSFFAYFPANSSPPSVLAEMLTATIGAQCMSWETSPAGTELEHRMMEWLRVLIGLPSQFEGVIQDSASSATLCAILSARERATNWQGNSSGLSGGPKMIIYGSTECHSSVEKNVRIAGLGENNFRQVPVTDSFAMDTRALTEAIEVDIAAGRLPICVVAVLGTTSSSAIDPLKEIANICKRHQVWLHVDAAWAGSALINPEFRWMIEGVEGVDSFVFNPHKWLFTNFDCSAYFVKSPEVLLKTLSILPEYLKSLRGSTERNYRDWGVPLGRRFRALKLWFVLRSYGIEQLRDMVRTHIKYAQELARLIDLERDFECLAPTPLALVCFRYCPQGQRKSKQLDCLNERLVERINSGGGAYITHTRLNGVFTIRISIGQTRTRWCHVEALWDQIKITARKMILED